MSESETVSDPEIKTGMSSDEVFPVHWQTPLRQHIQPYLPPPVIEAMRILDPKLEPYVGPEGSITVVVTLVLAYVVLRVTQFLATRILGSGKAIADDDNDNVMSQKQQGNYDQSVLLVGPVNSGKTRLFYQLCFDDQNVPTVHSIKANVGIVSNIRYIDWPGHADLNNDLLLPILKARPRIILLMDASQPVAPAADVLYQLLTQLHTRDSSRSVTILVACHKSDLPKAKNPKRVKIQLRTELERLTLTKANVPWRSLDDVLERTVQLRYCTSSCVGDNDVLLNYCRTGNEDGLE